MSRSRKFFSATVAIPANTAISLLGLMQLAPIYWGFEDDGATPSLDSIIGSEASITPDGDTVYVGGDENVRGAGAVSPLYTGVPVVDGQNYSLQDFGGGLGLIDPNTIWLYCLAGTDASVVFQSR